MSQIENHLNLAQVKDYLAYIISMDTQLTSAEIQNISQLLQDYAPARNALSILNETNCNLEQSFKELWSEQHGNREFGNTKLW